MATEEMRALPKTTSVEPELPPEQARLYRDVLELFNASQVPYTLSGAFALHYHTGIWRNTKDLDLFLAGCDLIDILRILKDRGFETEIADDVWLAKVHADGFFVDLISGMNNAALAVEDSWIERSVPCMAVGVPSRVLPIEELLASKAFVASRDRFDGSDVCHLIYRTEGRFDWDRVLSLLTKKGDNWGVLLWHLVLFAFVYPASVDFVPRRIWDDLLERLRAQIESPDLQARFRGSLLDENMFYIDTEEWGLPNVQAELRGAMRPRLPLSAANRPAQPIGAGSPLDPGRPQTTDEEGAWE